jgi:hypothetical protein
MEPVDLIRSTNLFAEVFAKTARDASRVSFELNFAILQDTLIDRLNKKIEAITDDEGAKRLDDRLNRDAKKLNDNLPFVEKVIFDTQSNDIRLGNLSTNIAAAISAFSSDDDDTNLTAAELATLEGLKDSIVQDLEFLNINTLSGLILPDSVEDLKEYYNTLKDLTPVEGTVDADGSGSPSNDNRTLLDLLGTISSLTDTADLVNANTKYLAVNLRLDILAEFQALDSERLEFNLVELQQRTDKIDNLKAETGNLLRVLSLSFENQAFFVETLGDILSEKTPEPGSVLNLFT